MMISAGISEREERSILLISKKKKKKHIKGKSKYLIIKMLYLCANRGKVSGVSTGYVMSSNLD